MRVGGIRNEADGGRLVIGGRDCIAIAMGARKMATKTIVICDKCGADAPIRVPLEGEITGLIADLCLVHANEFIERCLQFANEAEHEELMEWVEKKE